MRYIGAKTELLPQIEALLKDKGLLDPALALCDAFSGTCAVGDYLKDKVQVFANDIQYYSYVISHAKLRTPGRAAFKKLGIDPFTYFNEDHREEGFIYNNYAPKKSGRMYFSDENAARIDFIRSKIEAWRQAQQISNDEYYYLIACLLESASKVANVAGVYGAYLKTWDKRALKTMRFIPVEASEKTALASPKVYNLPIADLMQKVSGDILYLDPPYTATQYSGQYHLLETIARADSPTIAGKGGLRDTSTTASAWARRHEVEVAFEEVVRTARFRYIIMSYSSDGLMDEVFIEKVLKRYGYPTTYELRKIPYKKYINYHSGKDASAHCEYLFFIEKKPLGEVAYASPLNYQGGKADIIDFIKSALPDASTLPSGRIRHFVDVFGGGATVSANIDADRITYNEYNHKVVSLIDCFKTNSTASLLKYLDRAIKRYGLKKGDKAAYLALRSHYNSLPEKDRDPRLLYLLVLYGFHQQLRFNSAYGFNNPVGNSGFNASVMEKLVTFLARLHQQKIDFRIGDFEATLPLITKDSFVYCDPPYLITLGSYNDGKRGFNGWDPSDEARLYRFLDQVHQKGVNFMLSNVIEHRGEKNHLLEKWIEENHYYLTAYSGSGAKGRKEILVTNYPVPAKQLAKKVSSAKAQKSKEEKC